jgi:hypothetical protein
MASIKDSGGAFEREQITRKYEKLIAEQQKKLENAKTTEQRTNIKGMIVEYQRRMRNELRKASASDSVVIRAKSAADAWNGQNAQAHKVEVKDAGKIVKVHSYKGFKIKEYDTESRNGYKFEVFNKEGQEEWSCDQMFEAKQFIDSY